MKSHSFKFLSLSFLIVICITFRANAEKANIESPVLFGAMLMDKPDVKSMRDVCEYYGFVEQEPENGFFIFKDANGTILRLKADERTSVIEVVGSEKSSAMRKMLEKAGYRKTSKVTLRVRSLPNIKHSALSLHLPTLSLLPKSQNAISNSDDKIQKS